MPQTIQVTSRKFFNQITNDENFASNTGIYATHLLGVIGERVKADITFSIEWYSKATPQNKFTINFSSNTITRPSGSFITDGFKIGDTFDAVDENPAPGTLVPITGATITYIDPTTILYTGGVEINTYTIFSYLAIRGTTPLTAMKLFYGVVENSQPAAFLSKLDNTSQGFYASSLGVGATLATVLAPPRSWFFDDVVNIYKTGTSGYVQTFRFTHEFLITPFYLDGEQNNIENIIDPVYFQQNESLKYVFKADINTVLSNPNTVHSFVDDLLQGEVAYYNENFNGLVNKFSYENLTYKSASTLASCDGLLITQKTRVNFTLKTTGTFTNNFTVAIPQVFYLCPSSEYSNTIATDGLENFMLYDKRAVAASIPVGVDEGDMTGVKLTYVDATHIAVQFDFEFTTAEKLRLTTNGQYCISILVETYGLSAVLSDKVRLKIDVNNFDLYSDIPGLFRPNGKTQMWIHPYHPLTSSGFSSLRTWIEDPIMVYFPFDILYTTFPNANIKSITARLVGYNSADGRMFDLDSFAFDLSNVQTISGVQQIAIDVPRNFQLEPGDPYLNASISMGVGVPGSNQNYKVYVPFKMRYEDFFANPNVPLDFFDSTKENNNLNYKASNYYLNPDWSIRAVFDAVVNNGTANIDTLYEYVYAGNKVHDYDVDGNVTPLWTAVIKHYRASNMALLSTGNGGLILTNEDTFVEVTFTPASGAGYLLNPWACIRMEALNAGYNGIFELSSASRTEPANNPLKPETGQTGAKITQSAPNVKVTGLIDYTKVTPGMNYKISGRLGGIQYGGPGFRTIKITEGPSPKIKNTEQGQIKVTEEPI